MKKRIWIPIIIVVIVALIAGACLFGYFSGKTPDVPQDVPPVNEPVKPQPEPEPQPTPQPEPQPEEPTGEPVIVYVPDEQSENLTPVGAQAADDSDQALVDALVEAGALPAGVEVQSSGIADGILTLDMNMVFGNAVRSAGSAGESMLIYSLVNTFAQARGVEQVLLTVDGVPLESGHDIYDYPLTPRDAA